MNFRHGRWESRSSFDGATTMHVALERDGRELGRSATFLALSLERDARMALVDALRAAPYLAYFWETPPMNDDGRAFECVVVDAPSLRSMPANPHAFAERFRAPETTIATFENLGGDAELVVPKPLDDWDGAHLAVFVRTAPEDLVDSFFQSVAESATRRLGTHGGPLWVSTSGLGVAWLHVRLDARPKYYSHEPYRNAAA